MISITPLFQSQAFIKLGDVVFSSVLLTKEDFQCGTKHDPIDNSIDLVFETNDKKDILNTKKIQSQLKRSWLNIRFSLHTH